MTSMATTRRCGELERRTAELLGHEAAVYMPSGTMTNQVALRAHTESGDQILCDAQAHIAILERGAPAALSGLSVRPLPGRHGVFSADDVRAACPPSHRFLPLIQPPTRLVCVENTHNVGGGTIWPLATLKGVLAAARDLGLRTHLDGARIWNAAATGIDVATYASGFDSVSVCFSKGLGAPVGSALAGSAAFVARRGGSRPCSGAASARPASLPPPPFMPSTTTVTGWSTTTRTPGVSPTASPRWTGSSWTSVASSPTSCAFA